MKPVYIIGSNKGGVGKSLLAMALLDYFSQVEQNCFLVETELRLMDVHRSYRHLPFAVLDLSCELGSIAGEKKCRVMFDTIVISNSP